MESDLDAEAETGYLRDRNVFGEPITIEDTMSVSVRYRNGVILSYCLIAYSPWEGLRVAITGTKGRIELDIVENITHLLGTGQAKTENNASKGEFKNATLRAFPMFVQAYEVDIPTGEGGHGGADPVMLEQIFSPNPPPDPFNQRTSTGSSVSGSVSISLDEVLPPPVLVSVRSSPSLLDR